jgi:hypothetical protein
MAITGITKSAEAPLATRNAKDFSALGLVSVNPWDVQLA